ncbi:MAG: hypothetical protein OR995_04770 [Candidatus Nanopelagicales bacterium]|nr:hypothetical protein [Candidatus Nanopelagicales bacterium]
MSESGKEEAPVSDLGSWLISLGAPESITGLMPSEMAGLDIAPLVALLSGIGLSGSGLMGSELGGVRVANGLLDGAGGKALTDEIRWLPVIRS